MKIRVTFRDTNITRAVALLEAAMDPTRKAGIPYTAQRIVRTTFLPEVRKFFQAQRGDATTSTIERRKTATTLIVSPSRTLPAATSLRRPFSIRGAPPSIPPLAARQHATWITVRGPLPTPGGRRGFFIGVGNLEQMDRETLATSVGGKSVPLWRVWEFGRKGATIRPVRAKRLASYDPGQNVFFLLRAHVITTSGTVVSPGRSFFRRAFTMVASGQLRVVPQIVEMIVAELRRTVRPWGVRWVGTGQVPSTFSHWTSER